MTDFIVDIFCEGVRPDPKINICQWADTKRYLPSIATARAAHYRSDYTPYLKEIMESLSNDDPCDEVALMKPTQIGGTEVIINWFGCITETAPGPMMIFMPTLEMASDFSTQKLDPAIRETPSLAARVAEQKSRNSRNTIRVKTFPGGILFLTGANSGASFRSKSIRYMALDDIDENPEDIAGQGDSGLLAKGRTDSYGMLRKIFYCSTPTIAGFSQIEKLYVASDQRHYHVPCPFCGEMQVLEWGGKDVDYGIKFQLDKFDQVVAVWYECRGCHQPIDESHKMAMMLAGHWVATYPGRKRKGYHINGLYSPVGMVAWLQIVEEFVEATRANDKQKLKTWRNIRLALPWEEKATAIDWQTARFGAGGYEQMTVPAGGLILTAGTDTQDNRLSTSVWAWGAGEECWLITRIIFWGDPAEQTVWDQHDLLLAKAFPHESGALLRISAAAIDSQGHRTQAVYNYARLRAPRVMAIQGSSRPNQPIIASRPSEKDVAFNGKSIPGGVLLWTVGSDTAKSALYALLQKRVQQEDGAELPWVHFPSGLENSYFRELVSEKLLSVRNKTTGKITLQWTLPAGARNEALDEWVYAYAAAYHLQLPLQNFTELEKRIIGGQKRQPKSDPYQQVKTHKPLERGEYEGPRWLRDR